MSHTVMVTGADGFIGSHLAEELVKSGEKVRAFCLYNSFGSLGWIDTLPPEIRNEETQLKSAVDLLPVELNLADTMDAQAGNPGLRYLDYLGRPVPW